MKDLQKTKRKPLDELKRLRRELRKEQETANIMKEFKYIYEYSPLLTVIVGVDRKIKDVNRAVNKYLGYSVRQLVGKDVLDFVVPEHTKKAEQSLEKALNGEKNPEIEISVYAEDGSIHPILIAKDQALLYEEDRVTGIFIMGLDITERKIAEEELRENQYLLREVLDVNPNIIFVIGEDKKIIMSNRTLADFYATTLDNIEGLTQPELHRKLRMRTDELKRWLADDSKALKAGKLIEFLEFSHNRSGQGAWYRTRKLPMTLRDGARAVLVVSENVDELKKTEQALIESEKKYRSLYSTMKDAVAIHDIIYDGEGKAVDFVISEVNPAYESNVGISAAEVKGKKASEIFGTAPFLDRYARVAEKGKYDFFEAYFPPLDKYFSISVFSLEKGNFVTVFRDITSRKKTEEALSRQNILVEEKNIALRQVIDQVRLEKKSVEEEVHANVNRLLLPLLAKMKTKGSHLDSAYLELLEENLKRLTSSFGIEVSRQELDLTQREIEICNMIVSGLTSKEIAKLLSVSHRTVETHRGNIRKKLGIKNSNTNLITHLKSLKNNPSI